MKVKQITNIIDTYNSLKAKISNDKNKLQWELMSTGESEKTDKLKHKLRMDEAELFHFLDCEV